MKLEHLPAELWFLVLAYLSPIDAFHALHNVQNTRIRSILSDMYFGLRSDRRQCSSFLHVCLADLSLAMYNFAQSHLLSSHANVVHSLTLSNDRTPGQIADFLQHFSLKTDFESLHALRLIEPTSIEFDTIIHNLSDIQMIDIQSKDTHAFDIQTMHLLLYQRVSIVDCRLSQFRSDFLLPSTFSSIQRLTINSCDLSTLFAIFDHFPCLQQLTINILSASKNFAASMHSMTTVKYLTLRAFSIPFDHLQSVFPFVEQLETFSLSIICDEGFDYVNSDRWEMIIETYWPLLTKFQLYSELWHLTTTDFAELYPQLSAFANNSFWHRRHMTFVTDFYEDADDLHLIFYSDPYPDRNFSNQWGKPRDIVIASPSSILTRTYRHVRRLRLTIYSTKQMRDELEHSSRFFANINTLTVRFEQTASASLFGTYIARTINLIRVKHLAINDKCHSIATFFELVSRLPNMNKLTITGNHRILIKQLFERRNGDLLEMLRRRLLHLNVLYDGVTLYETLRAIRYNLPQLKSFSACLPHFEDFQDAIPIFVRHMVALQYLHIGLEGDNDKRHFGTQDMNEWFRRRTILRHFKLHIDAYTNSLHVWL